MEIGFGVGAAAADAGVVFDGAHDGTVAVGDGAEAFEAFFEEAASFTKIAFVTDRFFVGFKGFSEEGLFDELEKFGFVHRAASYVSVDLDVVVERGWGEFVFLVRAWVWYDFEGSAFGEVFKSGNAAVCSASADGDEFFGFGAEVFEFGEVFLVYDDAFEKNDVKYFVFYIFFFADGK